MKRVKIYAYQAGLVFKNGAYKRVLQEGTYWLWFGETVTRYDITSQFTAPAGLSLLQDKGLADALQVIDVGDNETVLQYRDGKLKTVLTAGQYAFWKNAANNYEFIKTDPSKNECRDPGVNKEK